MLSALCLRDLVLIDRLDLSLEPGFTALTGETGAGKSIILDGLGLALGGRADRALVRPGADKAMAQAVFAIGADHPARALLNAAGLDPASDEDLVLRRIISADGKSKAFVNDQPIGAALLAEIGACLVEVHGQRATHGLLSPAEHRRRLDEFGACQKEAARCASAFAALKQQELNCAALQAAQESAARDLGYLKHASAELSAFDPQPDEEDRLTAERALLSGAAKLIEDLQAIEDLISRDSGAETALSGAMRRLERLRRHHAHLSGGALDALLIECGDTLSRAFDAAADARAKIDQALQSLSFKPGRLEALDDRLHDLRALARKHACRPDELFAVRAQIEARLVVCENSAIDFSAAQTALMQCRDAYLAEAKKLSTKRRKAAIALDKAVMAELAPLKLDKARFQTSLIPLDTPSADGAERVAFLIAANPGAPFAPLQAAASGGELARIALAIKAALASVNWAQSSGPNLVVFDEIDHGVGGAVADAVGARLSRLAQSAQVLAITHSPQVAARADQQWRVEKTLASKQMRTRVVCLSASARDEELARMLSGAEITTAARKAAKALRAA
ncbi:MAG: DNA repair protein RecN [Caulobacterales bacterium]